MSAEVSSTLICVPTPVSLVRLLPCRRYFPPLDSTIVSQFLATYACNSRANGSHRYVSLKATTCSSSPPASRRTSFLRSHLVRNSCSEGVKSFCVSAVVIHLADRRVTRRCINVSVEGNN